MPGLWSRIPFALVRHPSSFFAVATVAVLAALAATSVPVLRAAVESESLQGQVHSVSPLAAGLEVRTMASPRSGVPAGVTALRQALPSLRAPVVTDSTDAYVVGTQAGPLPVVPMWRQGAIAHVDKLTPNPGPGVWISNSTASATGLKPGDRLRFVHDFPTGKPMPEKVFRVAGIYRSLDTDLGDPYWQNFVSDIRSRDPDAPPPPAFVLMTRPQFLTLRDDPVARRYELGLDPRGLTLTNAKSVERRFTTLRARLANQGSATSRSFDCVDGCQASSLLDSALPLARNAVAAVGATISVLASLGFILALAAAIGCGVLLNRQREDEVAYFHRRGVAPPLYAIRVLGESAVPAIGGAALGLGLVVLAVETLAPSGAIGGDTFRAAVVRGVASGIVAGLAVAAGAGLAFPREPHRLSARRHLRLLPWEVLPLVAAVVLLVELGGGPALAYASSGGSHPRLTVFLAPVLLAIAIAGVAVRALRFGLRRTVGGPPALFLLDPPGRRGAGARYCGDRARRRGVLRVRVREHVVVVPRRQHRQEGVRRDRR